MSFSNYMENAILKHLFGSVLDTLSQPAIYVGLSDGFPEDFSTGANCDEIPDLYNYARVATVPGDWFVNEVANTVENTVPIAFNEASGSWGLLNHYLLLDSGVHGEGNLIAYGSLKEFLDVTEGMIPMFAPQEIGVNLD